MTSGCSGKASIGAGVASGVPWLDAVAMGLVKDLPRALFLGASGFTLALTFAVGRLPSACISSRTP